MVYGIGEYLIFFIWCKVEGKGILTLILFCHLFSFESVLLVGSLDVLMNTL